MCSPPPPLIIVRKVIIHKIDSFCMLLPVSQTPQGLEHVNIAMLKHHIHYLCLMVSCSDSIGAVY